MEEPLQQINNNDIFGIIAEVEGAEIQKDHQKAALLLLKDADQGSAEAQNNLGILYDIGQGVPQDYVQAALWFRKAADQGYADAQSNLGLLYFEGQGVSQDYVQAAHWFRKAADQGVADAQFSLGTQYLHGQGVPQDYVQAMQWCRKAADQGHAGAQHNLGGLYNGGHGALKDYVEAAQWYRKAAEQGRADAQYHLGKLYVHGQGVPQDYVQAVQWNSKAADQGYADAQYHLGLLYDNGWGVKQDSVLALHWCTIAKASGCSNPSVDQTLQELIALVTPSQIAQAEKSTREWWAAHHHGAANDTLMNMKSNTRQNEMWAQTILFFVHEPMVALKVVRYPVAKIIDQFPVDERGKIKESIDAVEELGFFVVDENEIQLTDKGEALFQMLSQVSQQSAAERHELSNTYPGIASLLIAIENDSRLSPPLGLDH